MGQWPPGEGRISSYILKTHISLVFVILLALRNVAAVSHCRVNFCSRKYTHAINHQQIVEGANYKYCHLLRNYLECVEATAKKCRGDLDFHYTQSYIAKRRSEYNCSHIIAQGPGAATPSYAFSTTERPTRPRPIPEECSYRVSSTSKFSHCGVFGDPHLKTFLNEFQTCKTTGAWPLVDNPYLAVQITNERVNQDATATSKVTVIVRDHSPCTTEKTYEAQTNDLPGYFVDGSKTSGISHDVKITEEEPGSHVEITIRHIDTRIIIRQIGNYLTFAIKIPMEVAMLGSSGESLELCAKGCPKREIVDREAVLYNAESGFLPTAASYSLPLAESTCQAHNLTDIYFDACVFDLLTTGNDSFVYASVHAMKDAISLGYSPINNRTRTPPVFPKNGDKYRAIENGAGRPWVFAVLVIIASLVNQIWI